MASATSLATGISGPAVPAESRKVIPVNGMSILSRQAATVLESSPPLRATSLFPEPPARSPQLLVSESASIPA